MDLNPINQLEWWVMLPVGVVIILTYIGLRRFFVLPYVKVMEEREGIFMTADEQREQAQTVRAESEHEAEAILSAAREEADTQVKAARDQAESYRTQVLETASSETSRRLEQGRGEIDRARTKARTHMREQAIDCVQMACTRLLGTSTKDSASEAVDEALARFAR